MIYFWIKALFSKSTISELSFAGAKHNWWTAIQEAA